MCFHVFLRIYHLQFCGACKWPAPPAEKLGRPDWDVDKMLTRGIYRAYTNTHKGAGATMAAVAQAVDPTISLRTIVRLAYPR